MSKLRWGLSAIAALLFAGASVQADDLSTMKSTMEEMRSELATLRSQMQAQQEEVRSYAGGAPEALRSRNGRAALKIGGRMRTRYRATWEASDNTIPGYRRYRDRFDLRSARLDFQADFTPDTTAFLRLRLERAADGGGGHGTPAFIDEAWWQWRNICGTGINLRVGRLQVPFGEQYNGILPLDSFNNNGGDHVDYGNHGAPVNMQNPASFAWTPGSVYGIGPEVSYSMGDFTLSAAVFDGSVNGRFGGGGGWTAKNRAQLSAMVNSAVKVDWDPSMIEGLHVSASYLGVHNYGRDNGSGNVVAGVITTPGRANDRSPYAANYMPSFNLAADYTYTCFNFFIENTMTWNAGLLGTGDDMLGVATVVGPTIYGETFANTLTAGATYNRSEKLAFTGMFDWGWLSTPRRTYNTPGHGRVNNFRATIGAQYDFGNGIVLQGAYAHTWSTWSVENRTRHTDEVVIQSVVSF